MRRNKVFISYSHADERWLDLLLKHLKPLMKDGLQVWSDRDILPGERWPVEIEKSLDGACVAVLLLSGNFLASDFIQEKEVPRFLEPARNGEVIILPVLISACLWDRNEIFQFQSPANVEKPLAGLRSNQREQVLVDVAKAIEAAWMRQTYGLPLLSCCAEDNAKSASILRGRLDALARRYSQLEPKKLQAAIAKAMGNAYPSQLLKNVFPSVFSDGLIADWADLLIRTRRDPFPLDKDFLDALEEVLSAPLASSGRPESSMLSSLIVMVLEPTEVSCEQYAFRAFFCPDEDAPSDRWMTVDAKDPGYPIDAKTFVAELQTLIRSALECVLAQMPLSSELLLEIFLPKKFLHMDLGTLITLPVPGVKDQPIARHYPIVLRSSDRYQNFHERRAKTIQSSLPGKWDWALRPSAQVESRCCWWQDPPPTSRKRSAPLKAGKTRHPTADPIDKQAELFDDLREEKRFFSFRRFSNLPAKLPMRDAWLSQVINACPAVAIWWRPGSRSRQAEREQALRFCHDDDHAHFGVDKPAESALAHEDPFLHPHVTSPLRLFHAMASAVFHGRRSAKHGRALSEVVVLMESVERWPPRRDFEPVIERRSDQRGIFITVDREDALYSD